MKKTDKMMGGENEVLRLMVREKKATDFQYDALMVNFEKIFAKETEPFTGFVYLLNSSCSFCVGQFLGFLSFLKKEKIDLPIVVIVEEGGSVSARFYMKQVGFSGLKKIEFIEDSKGEIVSEDLEYCSGIVIYIVENKKNDSVLCGEIS